jgi:hypothetical protein
MHWPKEDLVRWVEWELQRARHGAEWEKSAIADRPQDLEIWLAKERDKHSWKQIGDRFFAKSKMRAEARRSEARRSHDRIKRYLQNPNAQEFQVHRLNKKIQELFGISARDFRGFILEGSLPRARKG